MGGFKENLLTTTLKKKDVQIRSVVVRIQKYEENYFMTPEKRTASYLLARHKSREKDTASNIKCFLSTCRL